jgi:hypothetical protein
MRRRSRSMWAACDLSFPDFLDLKAGNKPMWALPTLSVLDTENLQSDFDERALWCLLLFPKSDKTILRGLKQNWDRFSAALGNYVHVITLLDSKAPNSGNDLKFPPQYEASVGAFCNKLEIRLDSLPALFLINASDNRGPPYWPLDKKLQVAALEQLISDLCEATFNLSHNLEPTAWRNAAAEKFFNARSNQQIVQFLKDNVNLRALTRSLVSTVRGQLVGLL